MAKSSTAVRKGTAARTASRARRHLRVRKKVTGTEARPRLVGTRSSKHIVAQIVDDTKGHTQVSASTLYASLRSAEGTEAEQSRKVVALNAPRSTVPGE